MSTNVDEARAWIGRESAPLTGDPILARDVARYATAIGDFDPIYFGEDAARAAGFRGMPAPVGFLYWAAHPWTGLVHPRELAEDGRPVAQDPLAPPLPVERVVRGGDDYEFVRRIFVGDRITLRRRLADVYEKTGKSSTLVFVIEECEYTNQAGELVARQRITRIYR